MKQFRSLDRNQEELFQYIQAGEFEYLMPYWEGISECNSKFIYYQVYFFSNIDEFYIGLLLTTVPLLGSIIRKNA